MEGDHGGDGEREANDEESMRTQERAKKNAEKERKRSKAAASSISPLKTGGGVCT